MNRLLKTQLKKAYGKKFEVDDSSDEFKQFLGLISQAYDDFYIERQMLEHTLEVSSTELTLSIRQAMENHALLKSVTDSIDSAIFYKDLDLNYIGCNWHFSNLVGKPLDEIIGKNDHDLFNPTEAEHFQINDREIIASGVPHSIKEWVNNSKGERMYYSTVKSPLRDEKNQIIGVVGVARNLTKEYELEKDIEAKKLLLIQQGRQASMGEMIGNIAHQWRQPLNALGLIIQKLGLYYNRGILDEEKINITTEKSMTLINEMSRTIDDFRDFFTPNKEKESFSIREAIEKAHAIVESAFASHNIEYELEMHEEVQVEGYQNEFSQVIINLLNNAKDVLVDRGIHPAHIKVSVTHKGKQPYVRIYDNAGGISDSVMEKIFDPYFSTKEEGKGTGIGLYMSKMIIEDHMNGKLSASNTEDGACFTIAF